MDQVTRATLDTLERRTGQAERAADGWVRAALGGAVGALSPHWWFPEIPLAGGKIIWMQGCKFTTDPTAAQNPAGQLFKPWPSPVDGLWWAQSGDERWVPVGGRLSWHGGMPGTLYIYRPGDDSIG